MPFNRHCANANECFARQSREKLSPNNEGRIRRNKICRLHRSDNHDAPKARNPLMLNAYDF